ncbi:hypothetical protein [Flavobacterium sp. GNP002]
MKKIIVVGLLIFIASFAYISKKQPEKKRDPQNKYDVNEKQLMINRNNHSSYKFDEPINNTLNISNKQLPVKHSSRHRKGKIVYSKTHTFVLE